MNRFTSIVMIGAVALFGCGPSASSSNTMPTLPGDGDANTAKPKDATGPADGDPWAGRTDLIESPAAQPAVEVALPAVERFTLTNGLQVIVVPNHDLPVVGMSMAVRAGTQDEPRDKVGIGQFAAAMLTKGTRTRTADKIAETIDFVGGGISASASFEATFVNCSALSKDAKTCLDLLPDVVVNPTFPEKEMDEIRNQLLTSVRQRLDSPEQMAGAHFQNLLWGEEHVRGWPMSARTIEAIKRADLVAWHKSWFVPSNAILVVAGDVDPAKLKKDLNAAFRRWRKGVAPKHPTYAEPKLSGVKVRLVDKPDLTQAQIRIGHLGLAHGAPDFWAASIMNYSLGGGAFSSRLMKVVRSEGGKTYGARSSFDLNATRGAFVASTFTRTKEVRATIDLVLGEVAKMAADGPTESEVADAKANITGRYATRFESATDVAAALLGAELHGFDDDHVRKYALKMDAVTLAEAKRAASDRLDPKNFVMVIVGNAKEIRPQLDKSGWDVEVVDYRAPIAAYEREPATAGPVDPKEEKRARKVLDAAVAAKGGAKKLAAIKSLRLTGTAKITSPQGNFDAQIQRTWTAAGKLRLDLKLKLPNGVDVEITTAVGPKAGWTRQSAMGREQVQELEASDLEDAAVQMWRDSELVLLRYRDKGATVRPLPDETVDGKAYDVVLVTHPNGKHTVTLYINKKTKMLDRMTYTEAGESAVENFSDYKPTKGIKFAQRRHSKGPSGVFDSSIDKVEVDVNVPDSAFAKPE